MNEMLISIKYLDRKSENPIIHLNAHTHTHTHIYIHTSMYATLLIFSQGNSLLWTLHAELILFFTYEFFEFTVVTKNLAVPQKSFEQLIFMPFMNTVRSM